MSSLGGYTTLIFTSWHIKCSLQAFNNSRVCFLPLIGSYIENVVFTSCDRCSVSAGSSVFLPPCAPTDNDIRQKRMLCTNSPASHHTDLSCASRRFWSAFNPMCWLTLDSLRCVFPSCRPSQRVTGLLGFASTTSVHISFRVFSYKHIVTHVIQ